MRKLLSWLLGFIIGASVAATLVLLFAPASGEELVGRFRQSWQATLEEARKANLERRIELEAELARMKSD